MIGLRSPQEGIGWAVDVSATVERNHTLARAYLTANQAIANNEITPVTGYTESFDIGGNFNATTGLYTAPVTGYYHFDGSIMFYDVTGALIHGAVYIYKNSAGYSIGNYWFGASGVYVGSSVSDKVQLDVDDTLNMLGWMQTSDSGAAEMLAGVYTHFSVHLIST